MSEEKPKASWKQTVLHEVREVFFMVAYLAICFTLIATFRCLVLIQNGINDFSHSYLVAAVEALALGKIVALAQRLPVIAAWNRRALIYSVLYKSVILTLIVDAAGMLERRLFPPASSTTASVAHNVELMIAHQGAFLFVFIALFTWRDLDRRLGNGTLKMLFFEPPVEQNASLE